MKRIIAICCIASMCTTGCRKNDVDRPDEANYRLIKRLEYNNSAAKEPYSITEYVYDSNGDDFPPTPPQPDNIQSYSYFRYEDGLPHSNHLFSNYGDGLRLSRYTFYFYNQRKTSRIENYGGDGTLMLATDYEYEGDNLIGAVSTDTELGIINQSRYSYDNQNRLIRQEHGYPGQPPLEYITFSYDSRGRQTASVTYDTNNQLIVRVEYQYIAQQMQPAEEVTYQQGHVTRLKWAYNAWGSPISCVRSTDSGGSECNVLQRKYDGNRLLEETNYASNMDCAEFRFMRCEYEKL
ncbi:hypothetical protein [Parapedobacter sp. DT-150]|uniref:hypothetical protein n=1 Tax=Parapedobacter sp. DT-150 TaxID=3396162 RepID=UPI003F1A8E64